MISDGSPFFTLDRGTVGTAVALIGPLEGRSRLLAASSAPVGIDVDALLEDLAWRVARTDPASIAAPDGWRAWPRLEVRTLRPRRAVVVAASDRVGVGLEDAFGRSGWDIVARHIGPRPDILALGEACIDPDVDALVVGIADAADDEERGQMRSIWPLVISIASMREDLAVIACGTFAERPEAIGEERLFALPAPEAGTTTVLRDAAREIAEHLASAGAPVPDGHQAFRTSVASLAVLLNCRVEGIELGASSSSRTLAGPDREARHRASAGGALLASAGGERDLDAILRWSSVQGDPAVLGDRLRDLAARPWQLLDDDGARLRLAALRAALWRLREPADSAPEGRAEDDTSDVIVLAGGSLGGLPPLALALAVTDLIRRPGATTILGDHARVLAPLGALASERDRRRILADLMDDCLLPIGSTLLTGDTSVAGARAPATVAISSALGTDQLSLEPEQLRTVDLPPGIVARLDIDPGEGTVLGVSGRRLALEVSGGLGGLLIDTRPLQLSLPDGGEARRAVLETWERPAWDRRAGIEAAA